MGREAALVGVTFAVGLGTAAGLGAIAFEIDTVEPTREVDGWLSTRWFGRHGTWPKFHPDQ